mgnify:CR=1 FL=1
MTIEMSRGKGYITIPFFGDFKVDYDNVGGETLEQTFVKLSPTLKSTIEALAEKRDYPLLKHHKGDIATFLTTQLDIKGQPHNYSLFPEEV